MVPMGAACVNDLRKILVDFDDSRTVSFWDGIAPQLDFMVVHESTCQQVRCRINSYACVRDFILVRFSLWFSVQER
jgi:hypothetical protein